MRTQLPYRLIAATLSALLVLGVVLPVVQSVCAAPMHASPMHASPMHASPMHGSSHAEGEMQHGHASEAERAATTPSADAEARTRAHGSNHGTEHGSAAPCESMPAPCTDGCMSCCMVETDPSTWTTIRVVEGAFSTDVPRRMDVMSLIVPLMDRPQRPDPAHHRSEPLPVRLHVWTATFLT